jgi:ribosome-associated protein
MQTEELIQSIIDLADSKKADNIVTLNVAKKSSIADHFLICEGQSERQVQTIADEIIDNLKKQGVRPLRVDGLEEKKWIVIDYGDVIVHVFLPEIRQIFKLEELWGKQRAKST